MYMCTGDTHTRIMDESAASCAAMPLADALSLYANAPRLEPMTSEVEKIILDHMADIKACRSDWARVIALVIGASDAAMPVRGPRICSLLGDDSIDKAYFMCRPGLYWVSTPTDLLTTRKLIRAREMLEREKLIRRVNADKESIIAEFDTEWSQRIEDPVPCLMRAFVHDTYVYTDPVSGMQRTHNPLCIFDLRREVRIPASPTVPSLYSMALSALASQSEFPLLPPALASELNDKKKKRMETTEWMEKEKRLAAGHYKNWRAMQGASHMRTALALEQQLKLV